MTRTEYLLTCLAEECAEVAQRCSKALRFGRDEIQPGQYKTNRERLVEELRDLYAVIGLLESDWTFDVLADGDEPYPHAIATKKAKVEKYMEYSRKMGTLQ